MISAENLINTKLRNIFLFRYKVSLQKFIEAVFVYTFFDDLRNVGPNPGSPMNYRFFCNRIIYLWKSEDQVLVSYYVDEHSGCC